MTLRVGMPIVVSAPSGGGKTTICHRVIEQVGGLEFSVSHTTRNPRPGEVDGLDYHFVDDANFNSMVTNNAFVEWANVYDRQYGTSRIEAESRLQQGVDVLFDIDVQGGKQIADRLAGAVLVFIVPPDMATLERRLRSRKSDSEEAIHRRLQSAATEIKQATFYPYWIINDNLEQAVQDLSAVIRAERLRRVDKLALTQRLLAP